MTPELEAKEWLVGEFKRDLFKYVLVRNEDRATVMLKESAIVDLLAAFAASQLSAERKWWIERIEQERDKRGGTAWCALDDLLTSVRDRGASTAEQSGAAAPTPSAPVPQAETDSPSSGVGES